MEIIPKEKRKNLYLLLGSLALIGAGQVKMATDYLKGKDTLFSRSQITVLNYFLKDEYKMKTEEQIQATLRENRERQNQLEGVTKSGF